MLALQFAPKGGSRRRLHILAIGAHCDDVDIGCGGATLALLDRHDVDVTWVVFAANAVREREFRASAARFLRGARSARLIVHKFRDGFFPAQYVAIKEAFEAALSSGPTNVAPRTQETLTLVDLELSSICRKTQRYAGALVAAAMRHPVVRHHRRLHWEISEPSEPLAALFEQALKALGE